MCGTLSLATRLRLRVSWSNNHFAGRLRTARARIPVVQSGFLSPSPRANGALWRPCCSILLHRCVIDLFAPLRELNPMVFASAQCLVQFRQRKTTITVNGRLRKIQKAEFGIIFTLNTVRIVVLLSRKLRNRRIRALHGDTSSLRTSLRTSTSKTSGKLASRPCVCHRFLPRGLQHLRDLRLR